jgi:soluble lytic murein transglycosylase-like protein
VTVDKQALIALAQQKAAKYGLDPALACAVIEQESDWNPWAVRFEPAFYSKYVTPSLEIGNFGHTEAIMRATSWGLGQVMGQVARELGFSGPFLSELCDPEIGAEYLCKRLSVAMSRVGNNPKDALLRYNGGANEAYPDQVIARMGTYA